MAGLQQQQQSSPCDQFWEQIKLEANVAVTNEPEAGPQLYQGILSHTSLLEAVCSVVAHHIETELIPATQIKNLFLEMLTLQDENAIRLDLQAVATRNPSVRSAVAAGKFHYQPLYICF